MSHHTFFLEAFHFQNPKCSSYQIDFVFVQDGDSLNTIIICLSINFRFGKKMSYHNDGFRSKNERNKESGMILMASTMGIFIILSIFAFYLARFSISETRMVLLYSRYKGLEIWQSVVLNMGCKFIKNLKRSNITGNLNNGTYTVSFDLNNDKLNQDTVYTLSYDKVICLNR